MTSKTVTVEFVVENRREVPRIGQRKTLRVNGHNEIKYANVVEVQRVERFEGIRYEGRVVYGNYHGE